MYAGNSQFYLDDWSRLWTDPAGCDFYIKKVKPPETKIDIFVDVTRGQMFNEYK